MQIPKIGLVILTLVLILGCGMFRPAGPNVYQDSNFSFQYPESWQTMNELWGDRYQADQEYYQLGVNEIIMVTSVQKQGESGAWFAVASEPLEGTINLEHVVNQTYTPYLDTLQNYSQRHISVASADGIEVTYKRPWGEPWWQFRDLWLVDDSVLYVLSFHAVPNNFDAYQEDFEFILNSFTLK